MLTFFLVFCAQFAASASVSPTAATTLASRRTRTRENRRSGPVGAKSPERTLELASSPSSPEHASSQLARLSSVEEHPSSESLRRAEDEDPSSAGPPEEEDAQKGPDAVVPRSPPSPSTPRRTDAPPTTTESRPIRLAHTLEVELPDLSTSFSRSELDLVQLVVDSSLSPETAPPSSSSVEDASDESGADNHSSDIRAVQANE